MAGVVNAPEEPRSLALASNVVEPIVGWITLIERSDPSPAQWFAPSYQHAVGPPHGTLGSYTQSYGSAIPEPIMIQHAGITYTSFNGYDGVVTDYAPSFRPYPAGMIRFGRGRMIFGRRGY